jgi:hypothetical protein
VTKTTAKLTAVTARAIASGVVIPNPLRKGVALKHPLTPFEPTTPFAERNPTIRSTEPAHPKPNATIPSVVVISTCPIVSQESCCNLTFIPPFRFPLKDCVFHKQTFDKGGLTEGSQQQYTRLGHDEELPPCSWLGPVRRPPSSLHWPACSIYKFDLDQPTEQLCASTFGPAIDSLAVLLMVRASAMRCRITTPALSARGAWRYCAKAAGHMEGAREARCRQGNPASHRHHSAGRFASLKAKKNGCDANV